MRKQVHIDLTARQDDHKRSGSENAMSPSASPVPPSETGLRDMLGGSFAAFDSFLAQNNDLRPEWKYYGAKLGWNLKLFHKKRNLCFIAPHDSHWVIGFALGAKAVEAALTSALTNSIKQEIRDAKKYAEGRGVRFSIREMKDLAPVRIVMEIKKAN
jgi:hypothetical protein